MTYITNTEKVKIIRESLKSEFPDSKFSIRKSSVNGVDITILSSPFDLLKGMDKTYSTVSHYWIDKTYADNPEALAYLKRINEIAHVGVTYRETGDYGTQPSFYVHISIGDYAKPYVMSNKSTPKKETPAPKKGWSSDKGELMESCAGWNIYKKSIGERVVYNAYKNKETPANKEDRNVIKGEVYTQSGFKWGRFGFENWGSKTPKDEKLIIDLLCGVLSKYYVGKDEPKQEEKTNEDYKLLPANPKLEYCKIDYSEGFGDNELPETFQSFTAMTKFIADNIGEIPKKGEGYIKTRVEWKWEFSDQVGGDRWDVCEIEANPIKYPNLYASEKLGNLCYYAWKKETNETIFLVRDEFYATKVGKNGLELSTDQFNTMLTDFLTYYPTDDNRFAYFTPESRLERFKEVYPKLISIFEEKEDSKDTVFTKTEKLNKAIAGLTILANKGNEKARKGILGLEIILKNINK